MIIWRLQEESNMQEGKKQCLKSNMLNRDKGKLLEKRTSISAGDFPKLVTAKWPLGKVVLFKDRMFLDALVEKYNLLYTEIDYIEIKFIEVVIYHHNLEVPKDLTIDGLIIPGEIKKAIEKFNLPVKIK
jgi:hypothetical protein